MILLLKKLKHQLMLLWLKRGAVTNRLQKPINAASLMMARSLVRRLSNKPSDDYTVVLSGYEPPRKPRYAEMSQTLSSLNNELVDWKKLLKQRPVNKVSVVVLVLNNLEMTLRCIDSLMQSKNDVDMEVVVVDNGSRLKTIRGILKAKKQYPQLKLIFNDTNVNFALGNNIGFSYTNSEITVFLNNDTYVTDGWLDGLIRPLEDLKVKAVQPMLFYPDDTAQCLGVVFSHRSPLGYSLYANKPKSDPVLAKNRKLQAVTGACMAVRSREFAKVKGFDPLFINGQEDIDLCFRLARREDEYCYSTKDSLVYHDEGRTAGRGRFTLDNRRSFLERWEGVPKADADSFYKKDNFIVTKWKADSKESAKAGVAVYTPYLKHAEKTKATSKRSKK